MTQQLHLASAMPVTLTIRWSDLFAERINDMTDTERRTRWARWLCIARKRKRSRDAAAYWCSSEGCHEHGRCRHLRGRSWCSLQSLPCSINPILTMRHGMIGMACMGVGYEAQETKP